MTPYVPPAPAKKSNVLLWILVGVGGLFLLIAVAVLAGGLFLVHEVRHAGSGVQFKSPDGSVQIGGAAKLPSWVPDYPGSKPQTAFAAQGRDRRNGTFMFKTRDSADRVAKYYREQLEGSGFTISSVLNSGPSQAITAQDRANLRTIVVVAALEGNLTTVNVTYSNK